jgi:hypothetical protein
MRIEAHQLIIEFAERHSDLNRRRDVELEEIRV